MGGLEQMIAYRKSREALEKLNDDRALQMMDRKPNMIRPQMLLNTVPAGLEGLKGGGDAGLRRVAGRMRGGAGKAPNHYRSQDSEGSDSESDSGDRRLNGGFLPMLLSAIPAVMSLFGRGRDGILDPRTKGGEYYGKNVAEELKRLHGDKFVEEFLTGVTSTCRGAGGAGGGKAGGGKAGGSLGIFSKHLDHSPVGGARPRRKQVAPLHHVGSQDASIELPEGVAFNPLVPNAVRSRGVQVPNHAPEWFRNSGDIAGGAKYGHLQGEGVVEDVMDFVKNKAVPAVKRFFGMKGNTSAPAPAPAPQKAQSAPPPRRSAPAPAPAPSASESDQLASMGIRSNKDFKKWAVKNHPDKGGDSATFARVSSMADRVFSKAGAGRKKVPRKASEATLARREMIRKLMREHGMTLPEASRHIKEDKLAYSKA